MKQPAARNAPEARLTVRVQPGASRERIVGRMGEMLKVAVAAPPEKGRATRAVEELLARELGVPARNVEVVSGGASRRKHVRIAGVSPDQLKEWLAGF